LERTILRRLVLGAGAALLLGAGDASAGNFEIPMGPVSAAGAAPVRMAAADRVGKMVFARQYRPTLEDAIPERTSIFRERQIMPIEDWLREWGAVQIQQIGRPRF